MDMEIYQHAVGDRPTGGGTGGRGRSNRPGGQRHANSNTSGAWQHDRAGWQDQQGGQNQRHPQAQGGRNNQRSNNQAQSQSGNQRGGQQHRQNNLNPQANSFNARAQRGNQNQQGGDRNQNQQNRNSQQGGNRNNTNQGRNISNSFPPGPTHGPRGGQGQQGQRNNQNQNNSRNNSNNNQRQSQSSRNNKRQHAHQGNQDWRQPENSDEFRPIYHQQQQQQQQQQRADTAPQPSISFFSRAIANSSKQQKEQFSFAFEGTDLIDYDYASRAAAFVNKPPGRELNADELKTCVELVFGFNQLGRLFTPEEWFKEKSQEIALTVLTAKNCSWRDFADLQAARGTAALMLETNQLKKFLAEINNFIEQDNAQSPQDLRNYLVVNPPFDEAYNLMIVRLQNLPQNHNLLDQCRSEIPQITTRDWNGFLGFITQYLSFLRDLKTNDALDAYNKLKELLSKANYALQDMKSGHLILPTVINYSKLLSQFAITLERRPDLTANVPRGAGEDSSESLPERTANVIRNAFVTCLTDRSDPYNDAEYSRRFGIYTLANICLKILFACKKTGSAEQIFTNVYNSAPPLAIYPRSEQVTYLYYLGRFLWTTGHWYRAQLALQHAYDNSYRLAFKNRRIILIYLITSNMILGRFPSDVLYQRQEAFGFKNIFHPICLSIAQGDLETFYRLTDMNAPCAKWMLKYRILLQIRNRCEVLVWRSLARQTFKLAGRSPTAESKANTAPTLSLQDFVTLYTLLKMRARLPWELLPHIPANECAEDWIHNPAFEEYMTADIDPSFYDWKYADYSIKLPTTLDAESIFSSLIGQNLLNGYLSHRLLKFAIRGANIRGPLPAGFPNVWATLSENHDDEVPGWKKEGPTSGGAIGGGRVVHLTDARPVGVAP